MLVIEVELLTGRYVAKERHREAEWPPHPARLFSALVSSLYAGAVAEVTLPSTDAGTTKRRGKAQPNFGETKYQTDQNEAGALKWLERQPAPEIACSEQVRWRGVVDYFVPANDSPAQPVKYLPELRRRNARTFPSVTPDVPRVSFQWPKAEPGQHFDALQRLASRISYLGHSSSFAAVEVRTVIGTLPNLFPNESGHSAAVLRWVEEGQLDYLEKVYPANEATRQNYRLPSRPIAYAARSEDQQESAAPRSCMDGEWIIFRRAFGPVLPVEFALRVTRALREFVLERAASTLTSRARELLSGLSREGKPLQEPHVAWLALPFVGNRHATGEIKGLAVLLPRHLKIRENRELEDELLAALALEGPLPLPGIGTWSLQRVRFGKETETLQPQTWRRSSQRWATVTPIVLDRHPDRFFGRRPRTDAERERCRRAEEEIAETIQLACTRVELPRPESVALSTASLVVGSAPASRFPLMASKGGQPARRHVHAEVIFSEPISGPVVLGAGRYLGYGLCRPLRADELSPAMIGSQSA